MEPTARSWRHGSIKPSGQSSWKASKASPSPSGKFQAGTARLRVALALALIAGIVLAFKTRARDRAPRALNRRRPTTLAGKPCAGSTPFFRGDASG